jgi:hypothetical protein
MEHMDHVRSVEAIQNLPRTMYLRNLLETLTVGWLKATWWNRRRIKTSISEDALTAEFDSKLYAQHATTASGGSHDKEIAAFHEKARKIVESPIILPPIKRIPAKPNLLIKGLLAHLVSANDSGIPNSFDDEARELFFGRQSLHLSSWNLFYWVYSGSELFLMRDAFLFNWQPTIEAFPAQVLKIYPLGFMFTRKPNFFGLPNMFLFVQPNDQQETELPLYVYRRENHPAWPIVPDPDGIIFLHGGSYGLIARKD